MNVISRVVVISFVHHNITGDVDKPAIPAGGSVAADVVVGGSAITVEAQVDKTAKSAPMGRPQSVMSSDVALTGLGTWFHNNV